MNYDNIHMMLGVISMYMCYTWNSWMPFLDYI